MSREKVLFCLTSADAIGTRKRKTGYEFSEVVNPYFIFMAHGYHIDFVSMKGGLVPEDGYDPEDDACTIFRKSSAYLGLNDSLPLDQVNSGEYSAVYFPGGLGPMVDMPNDPILKKFIARVYENKQVLGAVCHGSVALLNVRLSDGSYLLQDKQVTSFTSAEERAHPEYDVPFMLDEALKKQGARHTSADPFEKHVVVDSRLVTGQNPASAAGVAASMVEVMKNINPKK